MKLGSVFVLLLILLQTGHGQSLPDPHFSQFYANPLYLNPAMAGANICPRVIFNYRNQWPALSQTFVTYNASFDMYIDKLHGGIGLDFIADRAGDGHIVPRLRHPRPHADTDGLRPEPNHQHAETPRLRKIEPGVLNRAPARHAGAGRHDAEND